MPFELLSAEPLPAAGSGMIRLFLRRRADHADALAALLGVTLFGAVFEKPHTQARRLAGSRIDEHHVARGDRHLFVQPAPLRVLLALPHMLPHASDAFDDHLVVLAIDLQNLALLRLIGTGDDDDSIMNF